MSQYGAIGYARHGADYRTILAHYYTGTQPSRRPADRPRAPRRRPARLVLGRHLRRRPAPDAVEDLPGHALGPGEGRPALLERARARDRRPALRVAAGGGRAVTWRGRPLPRGARVPAHRRRRRAVGQRGRPRGLRPRRGAAGEPARLARGGAPAQAVAARTYALTTSKNGSGFDQYADTRSQVYGGVNAETASTDAAVAATRARSSPYQGRPVVTYFFSTSGGRTRTSRTRSSGPARRRGCAASTTPRLDLALPPLGTDPALAHRGGPARSAAWSRAASADPRPQRGSSPRVVEAEIVGSRGRTRVDRPAAARALRHARHLDDLLARDLERHHRAGGARRAPRRRRRQDRGTSPTPVGERRAHPAAWATGS